MRRKPQTSSSAQVSTDLVSFLLLVACSAFGVVFHNGSWSRLGFQHPWHRYLHERGVGVSSGAGRVALRRTCGPFRLPCRVSKPRSHLGPFELYIRRLRWCNSAAPVQMGVGDTKGQRRWYDWAALVVNGRQHPTSSAPAQMGMSGAKGQWHRYKWAALVMNK